MAGAEVGRCANGCSSNGGGPADTLAAAFGSFGGDTAVPGAPIAAGLVVRWLSGGSTASTTGAALGGLGAADMGFATGAPLELVDENGSFIFSSV